MTDTSTSNSFASLTMSNLGAGLESDRRTKVESMFQQQAVAVSMISDRQRAMNEQSLGNSHGKSLRSRAHILERSGS